MKRSTRPENTYPNHNNGCWKACHAVEEAMTSRKKLRTSRRIGTVPKLDFFDDLPDDLVVSILCKLSSSASSPFDLINVLISVLRLDHGHTVRRILDPRVGQLDWVRVTQIRNTKQLVRLGDANNAVSPKDAVDDVALKALFSHGDARLDDLGVEIVTVDLLSQIGINSS